jgi:hypothetical protein
MVISARRVQQAGLARRGLRVSLVIRANMVRPVTKEQRAPVLHMGRRVLLGRVGCGV